MKGGDMRKEEKTLKAFANISRIKILQFLKRNKTASVSDIADATGFSYKAVSKHLAILYRSDIVNREQEGFEMHYKIYCSTNPLAVSILRYL